MAFPPPPTACPDPARFAPPPGSHRGETRGRTGGQRSAVLAGLPRTWRRAAAAEAVNRTADAVSAARSFLDDLRGHR
ncbi:MAG: hypothetical protein ABSA02_43825 [Trebonia sp.]